MIPPVLLAADDGLDERTDSVHKSSHFTFKDLRVLAIVIPVLLVIFIPVYNVMKGNSEKHRCKANLGAISRAILGYMTDHDDRFPPTHAIAGLDGAPLVENGAVHTWVTQVHPYMGPRATFRCPAAEDAETVPTAVSVRDEATGESRTSRTDTTYGMYAPFGGFLKSLLARPDQTVLVAETSNFGSKNTHNPVPFKDDSGAPMPFDGFLIGWNTSNIWPEAGTRSVTRLSFYDSADGKFDATDSARHGTVIHFLYLDGHLEAQDATYARVKMVSGLPREQWNMPPITGR